MTTPHDDSPYLGLRPFTEAEKDKFFGRDEEIHILTDKILAHRLTLLVAASGVGKSSLLQAGVMPQLRASGMADLIYHNDWAIDPARDLKHSIVKHFIQQQRVTADYAPDLDQPLNEFLQTHALLGIGTVVILLDQFEEFFYYQKFSPQRDQFIQQLAAALHDSDTPTAFVFSMREDFAMEMEAFKPFFKGIFDNIYRIEKLELAAARLAILKPIAAIGYHYQLELLEQLLADLGRRERNERLDLQHADQAALTEARVEPPHLQIVCQQLWLHAHASASKEIGLDHYQQLGYAAGILSSYFNDKMAKLDRAQQRLASRAFDLLVSQHGAKMAYPLDELAKLLRENPDTLQTSLDQLQAAAILRRIQRQGKPWYELYHDIFAKSITEWNQAYKKKQLREQLLKRGGAGVLTCLTLFASYDGWENHQQRHFRLGQETVSDRIEVYQGKLGSWDLFRQSQFLFESDFERKDIEADKRVAAEGMAERDNSVEMQIGELPLKERFLNYAQAGLFDSADLLFKTLSKDDYAPIGLSEIYVRQSIDRLLTFKNNDSSSLSSLRYLNNHLALLKLIELLSDSNATVRENAAKELGEIEATSAIPKLTELLSDNNANVRSSAASSLGTLKATVIAPKLVLLLEDFNWIVRRDAATALGKLKHTAATPKLITLLNDPSKDVRDAASEALSQLQNSDVISKLTILLGNKNATLRIHATNALGKHKHPTAISKLIGLLNDTDESVRINAAGVLGNLKVSEATPKLIELLNDKSEWIRRAAISALSEIGAPSATPKFISLLNDNSPRVRIGAMRALGTLRDSLMTPKFVALLDSPDQYSRVYATYNLITLRDPTLTSKLITLLRDPEPLVRGNVVDALSNLNDPKITPTLLEMLNDKSENVRIVTIETLGNRIKDPITIPKLIALRNDKSSDVVITANEALSKMRVQSLNSNSTTTVSTVSTVSVTELLESLKAGDLSAAIALAKVEQSTELLEWQNQKLSELRVRLTQAAKNSQEKVRIASELGFVFNPESVAILEELLKSGDSEVLRSAAFSLANIVRLHADWGQSNLPNLLQLARRDDWYVQEAVIQALGAMITFSGKQQSSNFKNLDIMVQRALLVIAQDFKQKPLLRMTALDALGDTEREEVAKSLLTLLTDPQQKILHFNITYWLAKLAYRPAEAELQAHFDTLVQQKTAWRTARDAGKFARSDKEELTAQKDNRWQDDYQLYQYAYALARIAPEKDGVALLSHPLYQVRQAAVQALAEKANGALLHQVLAAHQAFDARDLPSPFPTTAYRALDKMLHQLEFNGTKADLAVLKTLKAKNFPAQPKQQRALNERFDWTIAELEYRLGKK